MIQVHQYLGSYICALLTPLHGEEQWTCKYLLYLKEIRMRSKSELSRARKCRIVMSRTINFRTTELLKL